MVHFSILLRRRDCFCAVETINGGICDGSRKTRSGALEPTEIFANSHFGQPRDGCPLKNVLRTRIEMPGGYLRKPPSRGQCSTRACTICSLPGRVVRSGANRRYGSTRVALRFGVSPTGIRAISLNVFVSIADTEFDPAFEMYTTLLSGVKVSQSGTSPITV